MKFLQIEKLRLRYLKRFFLSSGAISVRLPISLNIAGKVYHLETNMVSKEYIYLKVYEEDFEFIPSFNSHILLFMNLDLFSSGKFELTGRLVAIDRLNGSRLGLWISYNAESKKDKDIVPEFVTNHYTPRYSVRFGVDIKAYTKFIRAEALNLSEKGIFIEAPLNKFEERDICILILYPENLSIAVRAEVSWINKGSMYDKPNGYGFRFLHDRQSKSKIRKYLDFLKNRSEMLR